MDWDDLDSDEQLLVMIAALLGIDFTDAMLRGAAVAVRKTLKRRATKIWRGLDAKGWAYGNALDEDIYPLAVAEALAHPQREALFIAAEKAIRSRSAKSEQGIWTRARSLAWLGVLQRDELAIEDAAQSYEAQSDSRHIADPIQLAWECAGGESWMAEPRILRLRRLISKLLAGNAGTQRSPESLQVENELNSDLDLPVVFMDAVADYSLLRGDKKMLCSLDLRHDSAKSASAAFLAFLDGKYGDAVRALDEAEELRNGVAWTVVTASVRVFTSIACGDLAGARKAASVSHRGNAQTTQILRRVALRWEQQVRIDRYSFQGNTLFNAVLLATVQSWQDVDVGAWELNKLAELPQRCAMLGWHWLAAESAKAHRVLSEAHGYARVAMDHYEWPLAPLGDLKQTDDWRVQLRSITRIVQGLGAPDSDSPEINQKRLAWVLTETRDGWDLLPYEQKMGKRGWTKGRSRYFNDLVDTHEDLDYLEDLDHQICRCTCRRRNYGYYRSELDWATVLPLLAEHPRLFRDNTSNPLAIRMLEAELHVVEAGDTVKLLATPYSTETGAVMFDDEYDSISFAIISSEFAEIARVVGEEGLHVPAAESAQIAEICGQMGRVATVHSDLAPVEGAVIPGDPRAHVLLAPLGVGLQFQLRVRPVEDFSMQMPGRGARQLSRRTLDQLETISRDLESEVSNAQTVLDACPLLSKNPRWLWKLPDAEDALETLLELQDLGKDVVLEWPNSEPLLLKRAEVGSVSMTIGDGEDWFTLDGKLRLDANTVFEMRDVINAMRSSQDGYLRMRNGQIIALAEGLRKPLDSAAAYSTEKGGELRLHPLAGLALREFAESSGAEVSTRWKELCTRVDEVKDPRLPRTLRAELRDYQRIGYDWLHRLGQAGFGACLADDMGLGKTVQALGLLLARGSQGPALVIAPTSVCKNWANESARFAPTLKPVLLRDCSDRAAKIAKLGKRDLLICSYGLLPFELEALSSRRWSTLILDEAQAIKNPKAKRTAAVGQLEADMRIAATGTPIENRLNELWSIFNFLNPGLLGTRADFDKRWGVPIQEGGTALRDQLRKLLSPFILRRRKEDVLAELPSKTEVVLEVELSEKDLAFYEVLRSEAESSVSSESGHMEVLAQLTRLRRACCSPHLVNKKMPALAAKLETFSEIVDELRANGHRALVFSQFVGHLSLLRNYLDKQKVSYQYLDGSTPARTRDKRVAAFQDGEGDLFLISLKAGGTGLNLTGADYVIHMDPWWNPAAEDQASDRAHRMGQTRPVTVYRLVARGTIEEKIVKLHTLKRNLADGLLSGNETATPLTREDLTELLRETAG